MPQPQPASPLPSFDADGLAGQLRASPQDVFSAVRDAAHAGHVHAQLALAQMYMEGKGVARDPQAALMWYSVAASNGNGTAMNMVGRCHELGEGTAANPALAAAWYRRAAESGLEWGMYNLANLLATGRGVARDPDRALALYTRAAHLGHAKSMNLLARHLEEGIGTASDPQAALAWYKRSAESGDFRGQANYASILLQHGDVERAASLLRQALAHGSPSFMSRIVPELQASPHPEIRELVTYQTS